MGGAQVVKGHMIGSKVSFTPGPRASKRATGVIVRSVERPGKGNSTSTFAVIKCDDGVERMARFGSLARA